MDTVDEQIMVGISGHGHSTPCEITGDSLSDVHGDGKKGLNNNHMHHPSTHTNVPNSKMPKND